MGEILGTLNAGNPWQFVAGDFSSLPAAATHRFESWLVTDVKSVFESDGTNWILKGEAQGAIESNKLCIIDPTDGTKSAVFDISAQRSGSQTSMVSPYNQMSAIAFNVAEGVTTAVLTALTANIDALPLAVGESVQLGTVPIPGDYIPDTDMSVWVKIMQNGVDVGDTQVGIEVDYVLIDGVLTPEVPLADELIIKSTDVDGQIHTLGLGTIAGAGVGPFQLLTVAVKRVAASVTEPTIDPFFLTVEITYFRTM